MLNRSKIDPAQEKQTEAPPLFNAPGIAAKLAEAESNFAALESRHKQTALDSVLSGDADSLASLESEMAKARKIVETLTAAHAGALEADERQKRALFAEQQKTQIRVCRSHLGIADKAAEILSAALADAVKQYRVVVEHRAKAKAAIAIGNAWPQGKHLCERHEIFQLVEREIARLANVTGISGQCAFPGGKTHDLSFTLQPELLPPLTDTLHQTNEYLLGVLTGKVTE